MIGSEPDGALEPAEPVGAVAVPPEQPASRRTTAEPAAAAAAKGDQRGMRGSLGRGSVCDGQKQAKATDRMGPAQTEGSAPGVVDFRGLGFQAAGSGFTVEVLQQQVQDRILDAVDDEAVDVCQFGFHQCATHPTIISVRGYS